MIEVVMLVIVVQGGSLLLSTNGMRGRYSSIILAPIVLAAYYLLIGGIERRSVGELGLKTLTPQILLEALLGLLLASATFLTIDVIGGVRWR